MADPHAPEGPKDEAPRLSLTDVREIVGDAEELRKGVYVLDHGQLRDLSRYKDKIFADAAGSGAAYKVTVGLSRKRDDIKGRCTCYQARRVPFCKHAAALLLCWARAPESFVVSESGPESAGPKKKAVRQAKVSDRDLMTQGLGQVTTLVRELATAGIAVCGPERLEQIRTLGESLRQNKLRRLSARAIELADVLSKVAEPTGFAPGEYADLLADLLLTAGKIERHLGGEVLDDRYVEELIGKTWQTKSLPEIGGLMLLEYAFSSEETADGFLVRESRFFELLTGRHYSEKQILPRMLVGNTPPKRSYQGQVLLGASGRIYPGFAPTRLKLESTGTLEVLRDNSLTQLLAQALPGVSQALAAFQEQRKDIFAPDRLPVTVRAGVLFAEGEHLRVLDAEGHALVLPWGPRRGTEGQALEARFASALRGVTLRAVIGEVDVEEALPTLYPLSIVVQGPLGLELRAVTTQAPESLRERRRKARMTQTPAGPAQVGQTSWVESARAASASAAALALAEVREELAGVLAGGLRRLDAATAAPLAQRLGDLGLAKQATLLREIAGRPEPEARLQDFIKLYQVLDIALCRLCGTGQVDPAGLQAVPTYESVHVRRIDAPLHPREVIARRNKGQLGRYEAAAHFARFYEGLSAEQLGAAIYPTWADGSATPFIVRALAPRGAEALTAARKALESKGLCAKLTAVQVLQEVAQRGGTEAQAATELLRAVADSSFQQPRGHTQHAWWYFEQGGTVPPLRMLAQQAVWRLALRRGELAGRELQEAHMRLRKHQAQLTEHTHRALSAPTLNERVEGVRWLAKLGDVGAAGALRLLVTSDPAREVRAEAMLALGLLGDAEAVDLMVGWLGQRGGEDQDMPKAAAYALGYLGDARGITELLAAFVDVWSPMVVAEALRAVGGVVLAPLLDMLEAHPDLLSRKVAVEVARKLPLPELLGEMGERLRAQPDERALAERARLYLKLVGTEGPLGLALGRDLLEMSAAATDKDLLSVRRQVENAQAASTAVKRGKGRGTAMM